MTGRGVEGWSTCGWETRPGFSLHLLSSGARESFVRKRRHGIYEKSQAWGPETHGPEEEAEGPGAEELVKGAERRRRFPGAKRHEGLNLWDMRAEGQAWWPERWDASREQGELGLGLPRGRGALRRQPLPSSQGR